MTLASPNSSMRISGLVRCAAAVAASAASTRFCASWSSPATLNVTSAERQSDDSWPGLPPASGDLMSYTWGTPVSARYTSATAARISTSLCPRG